MPAGKAFCLPEGADILVAVAAAFLAATDGVLARRQRHQRDLVGLFGPDIEGDGIVTETEVAISPATSHTRNVRMGCDTVAFSTEGCLRVNQSLYACLMMNPTSPKIILADITRLATGAIVNAANSNLLPGGGVCGAIFAAASSRGGRRHLEQACHEIGHCNTGDAVITPSFGLDAPFIIHAVGPVWPGEPHVIPPSLSPDQKRAMSDLASTYEAILRVCRENGINSVAIPAISTGIYGVPKELGAAVAVAVCSQQAGDVEVTLVAYDESDRRTLESAPSAAALALLG